MRIVHDKNALREALQPHRGGSVGFAPTMGFLHAGHTSLFERAASENDLCVASIFVNPTQFGPNEDLSRYPRDAEGDIAKCRAAGVDLLWMPDTAAVYAADHATTVNVDGVTSGLCGRDRPTHFAGVTTVVAKLFNLVQPTRAYFGEKDFQQLAAIRRMVRDLDFPIDVIGMPIVREADGLAMSSRNAYLSADQRVSALALRRSLDAAQQAFAGGARDADLLRAALLRTLQAAPGVAVDYADVVDALTLAALAGVVPPDARLVVAARVGATRLIDNAPLSEP